jgi:hypothetical protein
MKALFIVGTCLRLVHTDPWQAPTYEILKVEKYSYYAQRVIASTKDDARRYFDEYSIAIGDRTYEAVSCPGVSK